MVIVQGEDTTRSLIRSVKALRSSSSRIVVLYLNPYKKSMVCAAARESLTLYTPHRATAPGGGLSDMVTVNCPAAPLDRGSGVKQTG